ENRIYRIHRMHESTATSDYIRTRAIFLREQLKKGRYVLIPTTFKPDETGEFIIRMFTSKDPDAKELVKDQPKVPWWSCARKPAIVTAITIKCAKNLEKQSTFGGKIPTCISVYIPRNVFSVIK
ncbi:Calpain-5, partial [Halocaridina rubra]